MVVTVVVVHSSEDRREEEDRLAHVFSGVIKDLLRIDCYCALGRLHTTKTTGAGGGEEVERQFNYFSKCHLLTLKLVH